MLIFFAEINEIAEIAEHARRELVRPLEQFKIRFFFGKLDGLFRKKLDLLTQSL